MADVSEPKTESAQTPPINPAAGAEPQNRLSSRPAQPLQASALQLGTWLQVKSAAAISDILELDGTTEGLPFMPEMLAFCGRRFQLAKFANTVCANVGDVEMRGMQNVVVLKIDRCDGCFHGDCQMGCEFLWKLDWLKYAEAPEQDSGSITPLESSQSQLQEKLVQLTAGTPNQAAAKSSGQFFRCQATELGAATRQTSPLHFGQYLVENKTNGTPWSSIVRFIASLLVKKGLRRSDNVAGPCKRTPVEVLNLQPGDQAKVKPMEKILETLDARGCNRGLWFDPAEMKPFCGQTLTVTRRIDRIIDEGSGELLEMKVPSIVLNETQCSGLHRRFCSRAMLHFWREVWLERVDS